MQRHPSPQMSFRTCANDATIDCGRVFAYKWLPNDDLQIDRKEVQTTLGTRHIDGWFEGFGC